MKRSACRRLSWRGGYRAGERGLKQIFSIVDLWRPLDVRGPTGPGAAVWQNPGLEEMTCVESPDIPAIGLPERPGKVPSAPICPDAYRRGLIARSCDRPV